MEKLRKVPTDWQTLSAFDLAIKALEKRGCRRGLALPLKLAKPDFDYRKLVRSERQRRTWRPTSSRDLEQAIKPDELRLQRLRDARKLVPGG